MCSKSNLPCSCFTVLIQSALFMPNVNMSMCRSVAPTAAKKRKITQRLLTLSVEHQFVTPVTALLVESEDGPERLLADSPKDPRQGCCSPGNYHHHHSFIILFYFTHTYFVLWIFAFCSLTVFNHLRTKLFSILFLFGCRLLYMNFFFCM